MIESRYGALPISRPLQVIELGKAPWLERCNYRAGRADVEQLDNEKTKTELQSVAVYLFNQLTTSAFEEIRVMSPGIRLVGDNPRSGFPCRQRQSCNLKYWPGAFPPLESCAS